MKKILIHPIKRRISKLYLAFLRKFFGLKVIGITGSAGKTSTKEMILSILRQKARTVATYANIDPVYNIPSTILRCTPLTKYLVIEMGVEYPNEMDFYLWLSRPDVGVILNIYPTHTEFFRDEEGVFAEKKKLIQGLAEDGLAILNRDDKRLKSLSKKFKFKTIWFGKENYQVKSGNEFTLKMGESKFDVQLPLLGEQFVQNAVAAATCAKELGASLLQIKHGLETFTPPEHRMRIIKHKSGAVILDDTYNNNPEAAKAALKTFVDFAKDKKKIVVMGDMLELGELEEKYHRELGAIIGRMNIDYLVGVGSASRTLVASATERLGKAKTRWVSNQSQVISILTPLLKKNTAVLIKGSRSIHLENVVESILK